MITLNPKERFRAGPHAKVHADLVVTESLKSALAAAHAQWQYVLPPIVNEFQGVCFAAKAEGIREFIKIFLNLTEPEEETAKPIRQNLKPV